MENNFAKHTHHHNGKVAYLESAARRAEFSPAQLLDQMLLQKTDKVLDFGAGTGYFTLPLAKKVEGTVYALDIDGAMLEMIRTKAEEQQIPNIQLIQGESNRIPLPNASIDHIVASLVLHEIHPLEETLQQFRNVLKIGGSLVCLELEPKRAPNEKAPRITYAELERKLEGSGMRIIKKQFLTDDLYLMIAENQ
ncbi:Demethylmenaquinone methyltransferase [Planococcus massiliensis]|uniref:Demethylmenaquinone methyltransferase n=1 Tax=Planococcus massiliensis TaxID=1499687 RepID=A0A098EJX6_9BACL|nr:methyltransferase domain-containing protein [Planococcus massiliensis]CEG22634.1 Demethylmenaquinone methyltransferase [Planococcus massiliensis]